MLTWAPRPATDGPPGPRVGPFSRLTWLFNNLSGLDPFSYAGQQAREGFGFQFLEFEICDVTPDPAFCPYCPQAWDLGTEQTIVFESDFERRVSLANNWIRLTLTPRAPSVSTFPWPSHTSNTCLFSYYSHFYLYCFFKIIVKRTLKPDRNQNLTWLIDFGLLSSHHIIIILFLTVGPSSHHR